MVTDEEMDAMLALDAAIGEALGDEARVEWAASEDGGKSLAMWDLDRSRVEKFCASYPQYKAVKLERWQRVSGEIGAAWQLLERMRELGFTSTLVLGPGGNSVNVGSASCAAPEMPRAIAEACLAVLKGRQ